MITHVYYHADCNDGFGAAFAAWKALGSDQGAEFFPLKWNEPVPADADQYYFLDITPPPEVLRAADGNIVVIDHHEGVISIMGQYPKVRWAFSPEHSAAPLAWKYFHPDTELPPLLAMIEDVDLWRFRNSESKFVTAALRTQPFSFTEWDSWVRNWYDGAHRRLVTRGGTVLEVEETYIQRAINHPVWLTFPSRPEKVPFANTLVNTSEAANRLLDKFKVPVAGYYYDQGTRRIFGLRSTATGPDVSEVAKRYGGGGHPHAAGFVLELAKEVDINDYPTLD